MLISSAVRASFFFFHATETTKMDTYCPTLPYTTLVRSHPHQPAAFAHLARLRAAGAPSEALRSSLEAADQIAVRKGPSRIFGIDLRVIKDAERDRVEPGFFSDFINGNFQSHH